MCCVKRVCNNEREEEEREEARAAFYDEHLLCHLRETRSEESLNPGYEREVYGLLPDGAAWAAFEVYACDME